jgi:hypothetical protein
VPALRQSNEDLIMKAIREIDKSQNQRAQGEYNHNLSLDDIKSQHGRLSKILMASKDKTHERLDSLEKKVE